MATVKDLKRWYDSCEHCKIGYCCEYSASKDRTQLLKMGTNWGVYGWNWSTYYDDNTDTLYVSYYRNVPSYIKEK